MSTTGYGHRNTEFIAKGNNLSITNKIALPSRTAEGEFTITAKNRFEKGMETKSQNEVRCVSQDIYLFDA